MSSALKNKILSGVFWQGLEKVGSQGISFAIQIVLARLLAPKDFGVIALMMVFIALCNVVVDSGFSSALIQKKDATQTDFCSVFFINIVLGVFLYGVMFFAAPWVARFYDSPDLTRFLRFSSLALVITSFSRVQQAYLNRNMLFILVVACGTTGYTVFDSQAQKILRDAVTNVSRPVLSLTYYSSRGLVLSATLLTIVFCCRKERENVRTFIKEHNFNPVFAGLFATCAYSLVLIAMNYVSNVSYVQVFRQLGLLVGVAGGILILKERCSAPKIIGSLLIVSGLIMTVIK